MGIREGAMLIALSVACGGGVPAPSPARKPAPAARPASPEAPKPPPPPPPLADAPPTTGDIGSGGYAGMEFISRDQRTIVLCQARTPDALAAWEKNPHFGIEGQAPSALADARLYLIEGGGL